MSEHTLIEGSLENKWEIRIKATELLLIKHITEKVHFDIEPNKIAQLSQ